MKCNSSKIVFASLVSFLLSFSMTDIYAAAGCCSHHGGISGCNTATNRQMCKDGTTSPTCLCNGGKTKNTVRTKTNKVTTKTTTIPTTTIPASTTVSTTTTKARTTGCCSRHGGVAGCDKATGYQMCKDGTKSSTCKC